MLLRYFPIINYLLRRSEGMVCANGGDQNVWYYIFTYCAKSYGGTFFSLYLPVRSFTVTRKGFHPAEFYFPIKQEVIKRLVGFGLACAPVFCPPPIAASLLQIYRPKNINLLFPETKSFFRPEPRRQGWISFQRTTEALKHKISCLLPHLSHPSPPPPPPIAASLFLSAKLIL
jgi:hypothetical protein